MPVTEADRVAFRFVQAGRHLIAAGSRRDGPARRFSPMLFVSLAGDKGWATHHPMQGDYADADEAAAAALRHGLQLLRGQPRDVEWSGLPEAAASDARRRIV